jgi:tetratricopeptide (TPR) repeat protein
MRRAILIVALCLAPLAAAANPMLAECGRPSAPPEIAARACRQAMESRGLTREQRYAAAVNLGAALLDLGDDRGAATAYGAALEANPQGPLALAGRAQARDRLGDAPGAAADWGAALRIAPADPALRAGRGAFRLRRGDAAGALEDFDEGLRRAPRDPLLIFNRGLALGVLGRDAEAEAAFGALIAANPNDIGALMSRARLRAVRDPAAALPDYDRAVALAGEWPQPFLERGALLDALGRRDAADEDFRRAWELGARSEALNARMLEMGRP